MNIITDNPKWTAGKAVILTILTFFACSVADILGKYLQENGIHYTQILGFGQLVAFLIVFTYAVGQRGIFDVFKSHYWKLHLMRAGLSICSTMCLFFVLRHIPLSDFYGIAFAGPLCVTALSALILKEEVKMIRWTCITIGFIGILIIVGPGFADLNIGYFVALLMPIFYSISVLIARQIGHDEHPTMFALPVQMLMTIIFLPQMPFHYVEPTVTQALLTIVYGAGGTFSTIGFGIVILWRERVKHIPHGVPPVD